MDVENLGIRHLIISRGTEMSIEETRADGQWDAATTGSGKEGIMTTDKFGLVINCTSKMFQLSRGKNCFAIHHGGSLMDVEDEGTVVTLNISTGSSQL